MKITVEKIDDINYVMSGTVENKVIQDKVAEFKAKEVKKDDETDESIEQNATGEVFQEFIQAGIKEANIDINTILGEPLLQKHEQQENAIYLEVAVSTSPEIDVSIAYSDIIPSFTKPTAKAADVEAKLLEYATAQAPFTKIEQEKPVENGDVAVIDFVGYIDGKVFEGGSAEKFNIKVGSNSFIPGFEEQLLGMKYNEKRSITVTFPEDYQADDLAGKETRFDIKLHEIQEQKAKTPDDAFAKMVLKDPKATLHTLKKQLGEQLTSEEVSEIYITELKPKIIDGLHSKFEFTLPNNLVEQEIDVKVREKTRSFSEDEHKSYIEDKEKFMQLRESVRQEARKSIKTALIVEALAKKEGVFVAEQEVLAALSYQATVAGQDAEKLVKYYQDNNLIASAKMGLTEDKLFGVMLGFHKN